MRTLSVLVSSVLVSWICTEPAATKMTRGSRLDDSKDRRVERFHDLNLTDDQEAKIKKIRDEYQPKVEAALKELVGIGKEEMDKVRNILTPEQREKAQAFKEERRERGMECVTDAFGHLREFSLTDAEIDKIQEIRKETRPKIEKGLEAIEGILTEEQKKNRDEGLKAGKPRREILASLNLTDDQKKIFTAACNDITKAVREEMEKIREVLTEEQQAKLQDIKEERKERVRDRMAYRVHTAQDLGLTDDQKTKMAEVRKEYRPKIQEAGNKLRSVVREEVDAIVAVIK